MQCGWPAMCRSFPRPRFCSFTSPRRFSCAAPDPRCALETDRLKGVHPSSRDNRKESTCADDTRSPASLQPSLRHQNTHKSYQYNQYSRLKKHSANRCVRIYSEDREIIASSTRSNERPQAPGPSVNFKEETYTNGDLRNEGQKTQAERLKLQTEN